MKFKHSYIVTFQHILSDIQIRLLFIDWLYKLIAVHCWFFICDSAYWWKRKKWIGIYSWQISLPSFLLYLEIETAGRLPSLRSSRRKESSEAKKKFWIKNEMDTKRKGFYVYPYIRRMTLTYKTILPIVDLVDSAIRHRWGSFSLLIPPHPAEGFPLNCRTKQTDEHSDYCCW